MRGASPSKRRVAVRRWPSNCETRLVRALGFELPTELAAKFERHLASKTPEGRKTLTWEAEVSLR